MKKIKVLQFPIGNSKGGITQYALQNWKFIDKTNFQFDFATMSKYLDFADEIEGEDCKIHYISCYAEANRERFIDEFTKILTEGNYDVVHLHTKQWKSVVVEEIAKRVGIKKIIVHAHSTNIDAPDEKKRKEEIQLHKQILGQLTESVATDYWTCSWKAAEFIFGDKIPKQKIKIMNNAIDLSKYVYDPQIRKEYRMRLGISDEECVIGNVGRLAYSKNQEFLIKVFSEICSSEKAAQKYRLLLVGEGECEEEYRRIVSENKLEDKVIFTGYRRDIPELLQTMDIFCLPSRFEGLSIVLIEAQASGLPCIASDSIPEEVFLTENILKIPLDVNLWKESIMVECGNQNRRLKGKCSDSNQKRIKEAGYDIITQIKKVEEEYRKL